MADLAAHLEQARKNESTARLLLDAETFDWAITALFYAALHQLQAYLLQLGVVPSSHVRREAEIRKHAELWPIEEAYKLLRAHSENARYECEPFTRAEFEAIRSSSYASIVQRLNDLHESRRI